MQMVEVELQSLRSLATRCLDNDVCCYATLLALKVGELNGRTGDKLSSILSSQIVTEALRRTQPRYRHLLDALEHNPGQVAEALKEFLSSEPAVFIGSSPRFIEQPTFSRSATEPKV